MADNVTLVERQDTDRLRLEPLARRAVAELVPEVRRRVMPEGLPEGPAGEPCRRALLEGPARGPCPHRRAMLVPEGLLEHGTTRPRDHSATGPLGHPTGPGPSAPGSRALIRRTCGPLGQGTTRPGDHSATGRPGGTSGPRGQGVRLSDRPACRPRPLRPGWRTSDRVGAGRRGRRRSSVRPELGPNVSGLRGLGDRRMMPPRRRRRRSGRTAVLGGGGGVRGGGGARGGARASGPRARSRAWSPRRRAR
jgi:hypothetical protein